MQIHWLASYPKSGNTWVRFLLYHYLYGPLADTAALGRRIPDIHRDPIPEPGGRLLLAKTHWVLSPAMPHADRTAGAIYIIRHPKDVLRSLINFYRLRDREAPWTDEQIARLFINSAGDPSVAKMGYGSWIENFTTWLLQRRFPLLLVRYEDLKTDSARELRRMLEFLAEPVDDQRVRQAAEACTFDKMRAMEVQEKSADRPGPVFDGGKAELGRGLLFMRKGGSGQTLASIRPGLDQEFDQRFRVPLWLMGYGPSKPA